MLLEMVALKHRNVRLDGMGWMESRHANGCNPNGGSGGARSMAIAMPPMPLRVAGRPTTAGTAGIAGTAGATRKCKMNELS